MDVKSVILVVALLAGCLALPAPEDDLSIYFEHSDMGARVVGGNQAAIGSHPHMVAMSSGSLLKSFHCGGSLVTQRTVLTAAHCITGVANGASSVIRSLRLRVGSNHWHRGATEYTVQRYLNHPEYQSNIIKNDLGLLYTTTDVVLSNLVKTISLSYDFVPEGVNTLVAGWGRVRTGGSISANLLELRAVTVEGNECAARVVQAGIDLNRRPLPPPVDPQIEICTFHSAGNGVCNGDSGSALTRADSGQQIGVVSWGIPCAQGAPDMFVRISAFKTWLESNIA